MDPTACFMRWMYAVARGDVAEAQEAHADLTEWLRRGGFEPKWPSMAMRKHFFSYRSKEGS
jgi:hypothetical protein